MADTIVRFRFQPDQAVTLQLRAETDLETVVNGSGLGTDCVEISPGIYTATISESLDGLFAADAVIGSEVAGGGWVQLADIAATFDVVAERNDLDTTAIKGVTDKLNGMLELDDELYRYTAPALALAPTGSGGGGSGTATLENQEEILEILAAIQGAGWVADVDSLHSIREALRLSGIVVPDDMTGDPAQDLPTIRTQLYARLMAVLSSAKPNYSIDGQSVSWQSYQDMLLKQIQAIDLMIDGQNLFEITTRAIT